MDWEQIVADADDWLDEFEDRWTRFAADTHAARDHVNDPVLPDEAVLPDDNPFDTEDGTPELAVVEQQLPHSLFGFTRRSSAHVTVNSNLYKIDKQRTIRHEKTHHRHPKDELTIRYINGDIDVRNTLSFQANNAGRLGHGNVGVNVAAYGAADDSYTPTY